MAEGIGQIQVQKETTAGHEIHKRGIRFSLVLPVHNAENLLCDTVNRFLDQTFATDNFEIIIADAASTDSTGRLAGELAEKHPRLIRLVHCKEVCLNNARNEGLALAEGEYTCFWHEAFSAERNLLETVSEFLDAYAGSDVVCVPHKDGQDKMPDHWIFQKGNRVVNLFKEPRLPLENIRIAFFKTEIARKVCFDVRLNHYSFTKYLYETLSYGMQAGLCCTDAVVCNSDYPTAQQRENDPEYYLPRVEFLHLDLLLYPIPAC